MLNKKRGITIKNNNYRFALLALLFITSSAQSSGGSISISGRIIEPACQVIAEQPVGEQVLNIKVSGCGSTINASLSATGSAVSFASANISPIQGLSYTQKHDARVQAASITLDYN